jgi:hypothetical protein
VSSTTPTLTRKVLVTVLAIVLISLFAWAFVWQLSRALDGNHLSWAYVVEWPIFIGYTVYFWWKDLHGQRPGDKGPKPSKESTAIADDDAHVAAYNDYLRELHVYEERERRRPDGR